MKWVDDVLKHYGICIQWQITYTTTHLRKVIITINLTINIRFSTLSQIHLLFLLQINIRLNILGTHMLQMLFTQTFRTCIGWMTSKMHGSISGTAEEGVDGGCTHFGKALCAVIVKCVDFVF